MLIFSQVFKAFKGLCSSNCASSGGILGPYELVPGAGGEVGVEVW